jgi:hypothetical protein
MLTFAFAPSYLFNGRGNSRVSYVGIHLHQKVATCMKNEAFSSITVNGISQHVAAAFPKQLCKQIEHWQAGLSPTTVGSSSKCLLLAGMMALPRATCCTNFLLENASMGPFNDHQKVASRANFRSWTAYDHYCCYSYSEMTSS